MIRLALPAGELRGAVAACLEQVGLAVASYAAGSRSYRPIDGGDGVALRVFRERDIPIQVALGNYDLAICGALWVEEFRQQTPAESLVMLSWLQPGACTVFVAGADGAPDLPGLARSDRPATIVAEQEGLAFSFALAARLPRFRVLPVWGSAEAYPPEDADLALVVAKDEAEVRARGLRPLHRLLDSSACLIANRASLRTKPLGHILSALRRLPARTPASLRLPDPTLPLGDEASAPALARNRDSMLRLAVPDGHQQRHAVASLRDAGLRLAGYDESTTVRRPSSPHHWLEVKVIRPQDMAQQVALGQFDLAVTGRDWLQDHLFQFPSSPVRELVDLGRAAYSIAAVVDEDLPAGDLAEAVRLWRNSGRGTVTVASEYQNIADYYARSRHLERYRIVRITGASEGFVPEDAEILVEGTETGTTLRANRLKVLEEIFRSTSCLISTARPRSRELQGYYDDLVGRFQRAGSPVGA